MTSETSKSTTTLANKRENAFNRHIKDESLKVTRVTVSKKWQLPAKPKPGRKPSVSKDYSIISNRKQKLTPIEVLDENPGKLHDVPNGNLAESSHPQPHDLHLPSLDCGLCEVGGHCACDELGIKGDYPLTKHDESISGLNFESFEPIAALPLKRRGSIDGDNVRRIKALFSNRTDSGLNSPINDKSSASNINIKCGLCKLIPSKCICENEPSKSDQKSTGKSFSSGSCELCQKDPMCTLFCVSLASANTLQDASSVTVSCSQSYLTLSRHRNFDKSDIIGLIDELEADKGKVDARSISRALKNLDKLSS